MATIHTEMGHLNDGLRANAGRKSAPHRDARRKLLRAKRLGERPGVGPAFQTLRQRFHEDKAIV